MTRAILRRRWPARLILALALVAALGRAFLPAGYMPRAGHDAIVVGLCGGGAVAIDFGEDGGDERPAPAEPCAFAVAAAPFAPPPVLVAPSPSWTVAIAARPAMLAATPGRGLAAPPPPSRAPPVLA